MVPCRLAGGLPTFLRNPLPAFSVMKKAEADFLEILGSRRHFCTALNPEVCKHFSCAENFNFHCTRIRF